MDEIKINQARAALTRYCQAIRQIRQDPGHHPETSLYGPLEILLRDLAEIVKKPIRVIPQYSLDEIGAPDFGIQPRGRSMAFMESKSPDTNLGWLTGHDKEQLDRYLQLPNLVLTNFWEMRLYQEGEQVQRELLVPPECLEPYRPYQALLKSHDLSPVLQLLERYLGYSLPFIGRSGQLCKYLARAARLVRGAVEDAMEIAPPDSPLGQIYSEFRDILFYELEKKEFADAYAQTLA